ncbi:MAG: tetratricopeptide repeat protein [Hyphomonadaceae bacterium]
MPRLRFLVLLAGLALPLAAHAQPGLSTKPNYDGVYNADRIDENQQRQLQILHDAATDALKAQDFAAAEATLAQLVKRDPTTMDANFLMGLAKSGLNKWDEARTYLEAAVKSEPKRPEPKARLGLAYMMLDDREGASRQRAELFKLDQSCMGGCSDAQWIAEGLALIDQALISPDAALASTLTASPAPATTSVASVTGFDPSKYSLVVFGGTADLYDALTRDGRCAPKALAAPREPCALILYRPVDEEPGGKNINFRPVFRVDSRTVIWSTQNGRLQKVKIEDLFSDTADTATQKRATFRATALVGNAENKANCEAGLPCLNSLGSQDMFKMYQGMPDTVVKTIWGSGS